MPNFLSRVRGAFRVLTGTAQRRGYDGVKGGRLYADWFANATSSDTEIRRSLRKLLDRSRDLERNNDYQRGFLFACERNVLGAGRVDLRMDAGEMVFPKNKPPVWEKDRAANTAIELAWEEWGKKGTCTVCGRYSWRDVKRLAVRAVPRDGNFLARKVRSASVNRFGFALQLWEVDHLDLDKFAVTKSGGQIRFGIESDGNNRVVAYWVKTAHPGDTFNGMISREGSDSVRVPADQLYHLYMPERTEQSLGVPWVVSAITRLRQLGAFEEAATIAARLGASKAGFFKKVGAEGGEYTGGSTDENGAPVMDAAPGTFEALPEGWDLASWQPEYPNITTGDFRKAMLRGVATSLGMSYTTLGNDLESVNFSSARVGLFEEREWWKALQAWYAEGLWEPIFSDWLSSAMMNGSLALPMAKFSKFNRPQFKARRWPFIDPAKEVSAAKEAIALRIASRSQFIEEAGGERDDVFFDNKADEEFAEEIGLSLTPADVQPEHITTESTSIQKGGTTAKPSAGMPEKDDKEEDERARREMEKRLAALEARTPSITVNAHIPAPTDPQIVTQPAPIVGEKEIEIIRDPVTKRATHLKQTVTQTTLSKIERTPDGKPSSLTPAK